MRFLSFAFISFFGFCLFVFLIVDFWGGAKRETERDMREEDGKERVSEVLEVVFIFSV